ncbi:MAG: DUF4157 domain-containing protein [Bacteroidota bacterium]
MKRIRKKKKTARAQENKTSNAFFPGVQTKLAIGKADDAFEKEADNVADEVVNKGSDSSGIQKKGSEEEQIQEKPADSITSIQKMGGAEEKEEPVQKADEKEEEPVQKMEEEEETMQMKEEEEEAMQMKEEEEETLQQKAEEEEPVQKMEEEEEAVQAKSNGSDTKNANVETKLKKSKGGGHKMKGDILTEMEQGFGADFSHINIHTGADAQAMSEQLGAQAFTSGNDVYFNQGKYDPSTKEGKHLLAHELTHTIQQKGKAEKDVQKKVKVSGTDAKTRKKFLDKMNDGTSVKFKFGTGGELELVDKKAVGTDVFTKKMIGALKNPQNVELRLIVKNDGIFIDSFGSGEVDTADMLGLSTTMFKASLLHFIVERFTIADYEKNKGTASKADFDKAHTAGLNAEEEFLKEIYPKKTIKYKTEYLDQKSKVVDKNKDGTINYIIDFTDVQYVFTQPIVKGKVLENITKSSIKVIK